MSTDPMGGRSGPAASSPDLAEALTLVSRMRHEVNNHLTSALAEVQLLLMDVDSEELRESYEILQESLRSIRASVAAVSHLRP